MITKKTDIYDKFNRKGHLHFEGGYYIFKPDNLSNTSLTYRDISTPLTKKTRKLNITKITDKLKKSIPKVEGNIEDIIRKLTQFEFDSKNMILTDKKISHPKKTLLIKEYDSINSFHINWLDMNDKETLLQYLIRKLDSLTEVERKIITRIRWMYYSVFSKRYQLWKSKFSGNTDIFGLDIKY